MKQKVGSLRDKQDQQNLNYTKERGRRPKLTKFEIKKGIAQQIPMMSRGSLGTLQKFIF
jgi:hypothetical protein